MLFRHRLVQLRQAAGMTQDGLAEKAGIPLPTVRKYEQGRRMRVPFSAVVALARALGVDCTEFAACSDMVSEVGSPAPGSKPRPKGKRT